MTLKKARERKATSITAVVLIFLLIAFCGCAAFDRPSRQELEAVYGTNAPIIESAFAAATVQPRSIWRIYLKGKDPDGDVDHIQVWTDVPWYSFPAIVSLESGGAVSGYLELDTVWFLSYSPAWIRVQLMLMDHAGHKSNLVEFRTSISARTEPKQPPEGVYRKQSLGKIPVQRIPGPTFGR